MHKLKKNKLPNRSKTNATEPAAERRAQPTAFLSHNVIRPNLLTLLPTYSYKMITIDNKLFTPTIKIKV